jgi:hypothetical protein
MWALLSTRLRTWLLLTVAVPLAGVLARSIGRRLERRNGPTRLSRALLSMGDLASRRRRRRRERDLAAGGQSEATRERPIGFKSRR